MGERGESLSGLRQDSRYGHLFQIPGAGLDGVRWLLSGIVREPLEGAEYLCTYGKDTGTGGRQPTGLGFFSRGSDAGGTPIWDGDVGNGPPHGQGPGDFSAQSHKADFGDTAKATGGWYLGLPTAGDSDGEGGV